MYDACARAYKYVQEGHSIILAEPREGETKAYAPELVRSCRWKASLYGLSFIPARKYRSQESSSSANRATRYKYNSPLLYTKSELVTFRIMYVRILISNTIDTIEIQSLQAMEKNSIFTLKNILKKSLTL